MRRFLLTAALCVASAIAIAQVGPMFPGPQSTLSPPLCASNAINGTYANVVRLYHLNNSFVDNGPLAVNGIKVGTSTFSSVQTKFWPFSLLNATANATANGITPGGTGTWLNITGDFTFELWVYMTSTYQYQVFFGDQGATRILSTGYNAAVFSTGEDYDYAVGIVARTTSTFPQNAWHHLAFVRSGTASSIYLDGVSQALTTSAASTGKLGNGTAAQSFLYYNAASYGVVGYVNELRVSNVARYTANFTPQTLPFCNN